RTSERVRLPENGVPDPSYVFESLGYQVPDRQLDPYFAEFLPGKRVAEMRTHSHPGFEFVFLLDGELEIHHGETVERLAARDAVYFDATTPHLYVCTSKTPAKALVITVNPPAQATAPVSKHFGPPTAEVRKPDGIARPTGPQPPYNGLAVASRLPMRQP
ncbi:MAG TPA: cupin domain-containing protein, partial [Terriglobales bacterium]